MNLNELINGFYDLPVKKIVFILKQMALRKNVLFYAVGVRKTGSDAENRYLF